MKKIIALLTLSVLLFMQSNASDFRPILFNLTDVTVYFKTGSSKDLAKYFDQAINLNINGHQGDYSKNQAEFILKDFFIKYPPTDFKILHKGGSPGPTMFFVGSYTTDTDQFRILIKGADKGDLMKIYSLEIIKMRF
ncbi:DUF4783 domain-containing protein [Aquiflexum lacus]|uniref:DUF4783 domain-containing protein n=1 Tax=Aquiflexum lacus TaxID=2483805 RepID=UPI001895E43F|nr:DUF4783 domain-containing protein [Aquiflexum lacus]